MMTFPFAEKEEEGFVSTLIAAAAPSLPVPASRRQHAPSLGYHVTAVGYRSHMYVRVWRVDVYGGAWELCWVAGGWRANEVRQRVMAPLS